MPLQALGQNPKKRITQQRKEAPAITDLEKLKLLLGKEDASQDSALLFALETVEELIKNYCNLDQLPPRLANTKIHMAADFYKNGSLGQAEAMEAQSVTRGDVTVTYGSRAAGSSTGEQNLLGDYRGQLQTFRKLRW